MGYNRSQSLPTGASALRAEFCDLSNFQLSSFLRDKTVPYYFRFCQVILGLFEAINSGRGIHSLGSGFPALSGRKNEMTNEDLVPSAPSGNRQLLQKQRPEWMCRHFRSDAV
jgi:hypothetical protein